MATTPNTDVQKWLAEHKLCPGIRFFTWMLGKAGQMISLAELSQKSEIDLKKILSWRYKVYLNLTRVVTFLPIISLCSFISYKGWGWAAWAGAWVATCGWVILARGVLGLREMVRPPAGRDLFIGSATYELYSSEIRRSDPVWYLDFLLAHTSETYISHRSRELLEKIARRKRSKRADMNMGDENKHRSGL